tara:strand:+ start:737 stop:1033 length:297 start_codon:yes stop_codon:yes gene_type:complete
MELSKKAIQLSQKIKAHPDFKGGDLNQIIEEIYSYDRISTHSSECFTYLYRHVCKCGGQKYEELIQKGFFEVAKSLLFEEIIKALGKETSLKASTKGT